MLNYGYAKGHTDNIWLAAYNNASSPVMAAKVMAEVSYW